MKTTKTELLTGLFVVLGIAALAWLALKLGAGSRLGGETYLLESRFANAGGLHSGNSVLLAGVTVGRVEGLRMDPKDYSAIATLRIVSELKLPADTMAAVKTAGLIGDKYVALSPGADTDFLKPGERITLTESAVDIESLIGKMAFGSVSKDSKGRETNTETRSQTAKTTP